MAGDDVLWVVLLLAPTAAAATAALLRWRPRYRSRIVVLCVFVLAVIATAVALRLRLRSAGLNASTPGVAFASFCAMAACCPFIEHKIARRSLSIVALGSVVLVYLFVILAFAIVRFLLPPEPTSVAEVAPGIVCETRRWAIIGDGGTAADLYEVLPLAPLLMRWVAGGSASDSDGGFGCEDALARYRDEKAARPR